MNAKQNRSAFRNRDFSDFHRSLNGELLATDIDIFSIVEIDYNRYGKPVGLIEGKAINERSSLPYDSCPKMLALKALADASRIPFFITEYDIQGDDFGTFHVIPMNVHARNLCKETITLNGREYQQLLFTMRDYHAE